MKVAVWRKGTPENPQNEVTIEELSEEFMTTLMEAVMDGAQVMETPDGTLTVTDGNETYSLRQDGDERELIATVRRICEAGGMKFIDRTAN